MKKQIRTPIQNEKGTALVLALVFVAFVGVMIPAVEYVNSSTNKPQAALKDVKEGAKVMEIYAQQLKKGMDTYEQAILAGAPPGQACAGGPALKFLNKDKDVSVCIPNGGVLQIAYAGNNYPLQFNKESLEYGAFVKAKPDQAGKK